jgi:hypothetical protein
MQLCNDPGERRFCSGQSNAGHNHALQVGRGLGTLPPFTSTPTPMPRPYLLVDCYNVAMRAYFERGHEYEPGACGSVAEERLRVLHDAEGYDVPRCSSSARLR